MKSPRIHGVDLGYGLLLFMIVALGTACSQTNVLISDVKGEFNLLYDSAVAAFLFLNASLLSKKLASVPSRNVALAVRKQAAVLILAGAIQFIFHPCSFLLLLGICMFIGSYLATLSSSIVSFGLAMSVIGSIYLFTNPPGVIGDGIVENVIWVGQTIFIDGYFSILPWICFYLAGILFSRLEISQVRPIAMLVGLALIGLSFFVENQLNLELLETSNVGLLLFPKTTFLLPAFLIFGFGIGVLFWSVFVLSTQSSWMKFLGVLGSMRYSIMIFTAILEIIIQFLIEPNSPTTMIISNIVIWAIVIPVVVVWRKQFTLGPVERWFRSIFNP